MLADMTVGGSQTTTPRYEVGGRRSGEVAAGDLLVVGLQGDSLDGAARDLLDEVRPLGVILFARNMPDRATLERLVADLRERDPTGIVAIDHEGGRVDRLPPGFTKFPPALTIARKGDPGLIREVARAQARELRAIGFNVNFAPVLDIHTNPANPIIGDRAFGSTPEEVIHHALPYLQGMTEEGMLGCGKHFPGHGDTRSDSHLELPRVPLDAARLRSVEMLPFAKAINAGVPMIMTAHVLYEALDSERPASLSSAILEGILRKELRFGGVVVSDDLEMKAVADRYNLGEAAVLAVEAGSDVALVCKTPECIRSAHASLSRALASGRLAPPRLQDSAARRARLLARASRLARLPVDPASVGCAEHARLAAACA
jgi:beta-N-acetylhexosaminidase